MPLILPELWALDHAAAFLYPNLAGSADARVLALAGSDGADALLARFPHAHLADAAAGQYAGAVWFKPSGDWTPRLPELRRTLAPRAPLAIVTPGRLAPRGQPNPALLMRQVRRIGFRIEHVLGFGSPATLAAAAAVRGARAAGRLDLADRGEAAYRLSVRPKSGPRLSLCTLVLARA